MNSNKAPSASEGAAHQPLSTDRLVFIPYPRKVPLPGKKDLYWPAMRYSNMNEAATLDFHKGFQCRVGTALLDVILEGLPDESPICRLLGFDDGTFAQNLSEAQMFPFVQNMGTKVVNGVTKDQFFDLTQEPEQNLHTLYRKALQEAKSILREGGGRSNSVTSLELQPPKRPKTLDLPNNNEGGGGGGGNDGKPDDDSSKPFAARLEAAAPVPAVPEAMPAQQPLAPIPQNAQALVAVNNNNNNDNNNEAKPAAQEQQVAVAAAETTAEPEPTQDNDKNPQPPGTPPFHSNGAPLEPTEPWNNVWNRMRRAGWIRRTSLDTVDGYIFIKPGKNTFDGVRGVDYFTSIRDVQRYVQNKAPQWQPPVPIATDAEDDGRAAVAPQMDAQEDLEEDERRGISSAATVVTAGSMSPPTTAKPISRARRTTRPASTTTAANLGPDRLWWQDKKGRNGKAQAVPTLNDVKDILEEKLGIRQDQRGVFHLPERINDDDKEETPELEDSDALRKYLCTKGIPTVKGESLLNHDEQELLHKWVSFAYVPKIKSKSIATVALPADEIKLISLLYKVKFEKCDQTFFPPNVDHCGVQRDLRVPGVHFFRGLPEVRDYIRRTASFTWTPDELDWKKDQEEELDMDEELMIRLWAASSPSPLLTYETSMDEMHHLDQRFPINQNYIDEDLEDEEMAESEEEPAEDESVEEDSCASPATVHSSDASVTDTDAPMSESEQEDSPIPARRDVKATGKRVREAEQPKTQSTTRNQRGKKAKYTRPWWQVTPVPSFEIVRPILKKLGISRDGNGIFVLPGKDENNKFSDPESLRRCLCSEGIPKFSGSKKPNLSDKQSDLLRRWVSFAFVPVTPETSVEELQNVTPVIDKHLTKELHIVPFLGKFGFQRNTEGEGYFPPGIDRLGRGRKVRTDNLKKDFVEVREYIRCSEKLVLGPSVVEEEEDDEHDPTDVLALRLWGALEPSPLRTYVVSATPESALDLGNQVETPVAKRVKKNGKKKSSDTMADLDVELDYPEWWNKIDQDHLTKLIEDLKENEEKQRAGSGRRRAKEIHMTWQQMELACQVRSRMESIAVSSPRKGVDPETVTLEGQIDELAVAWNYSQKQIEAFLTGDEKRHYRKAIHCAIETLFRGWLSGDTIPPSTNKSDKKKKAKASSKDMTSSKVEAVELASMEIVVASKASTQRTSEGDESSAEGKRPSEEASDESSKSIEKNTQADVLNVGEISEPSESRSPQCEDVKDKKSVEGSPAASAPKHSDALVMEVDEPVIESKGQHSPVLEECTPEAKDDLNAACSSNAMEVDEPVAESKGRHSPVPDECTTKEVKDDSATSAQASDHIGSDLNATCPSNAMEVDDRATEPTDETGIESKVSGNGVAGNQTIPMQDLGKDAEEELRENRHHYGEIDFKCTPVVTKGPFATNQEALGASSTSICFDDEFDGKTNPRRVTDYPVAAGNEKEKDEFLERPGMEDICSDNESYGDNADHLATYADDSALGFLTQPASP